MAHNETNHSNHTLAELESAFAHTLFNSFDTGYYIGMMSGTSLDGMDAVICYFDDIETQDDANQDAADQNNTANQNSTTALKDEAIHRNEKAMTSSRIVATLSVAFPSALREVLLALCQPNGTSQLSDLSHKLMSEDTTQEQVPQSELEWFGWASREYAEFASQMVNDLLDKTGIEPESILAIGCHGQTVRHRPNLGFSLQLVDPNIIAERTGISVVTDFRRRDMAVGGQGAPLTPAFHLAQFGFDSSANAQNRIIVNLGGIANITVLPAGKADEVIGYDTGPANMLLDAWYQFHVKHSDLLTRHPDYEPLYDKDGQWAKTGEVNKALLNQLLAHPYFNQPTPKSTGREDFHLNWLTEQLRKVTVQMPNGSDNPISPEDVQATLTAFTAQTLTDAIQAEATRLHIPEGEIVVCGGGAHNTYLLEYIANRLPNWAVLSSEDFGIAPTWVEALAFAWLARQTIMGETGNLPAVTGASKPVVLGQVCFA